MDTEFEILGTTNFKDQYELTLIRRRDAGELMLLIKGDELSYPQRFTHVAVKLENLEEHDQLFYANLGTGGCQICKHHTELTYIADFALLNEGSLVAMKHLGICESCYQELEQAVKLTIEKEFYNKVTSEYI